MIAVFTPYYPQCSDLPGAVDTTIIFGYHHSAPSSILENAINLGMRLVNMETILIIVQALDIK